MAEQMVPQGFYRVTFDGCQGVGYCTHYTSEVMEETYEDWSLMYLRSDRGGFQHIFNSHINSRSRSYNQLTIGRRIRGLPSAPTDRRMNYSNASNTDTTTPAPPATEARGMAERDRIAPDDGIWVCGACGKTAVDRYGINGEHTHGWDESCMLNAVLCKRTGIAPGQQVTKADPYDD